MCVSGFLRTATFVLVLVLSMAVPAVAQEWTEYQNNTRMSSTEWECIHHPHVEGAAAPAVVPARPRGKVAAVADAVVALATPSSRSQTSP